MMNDKSLENHLNAVKEGKPIPKPVNNEYTWAPKKPEGNSKIPIKTEILIDLYRSTTKSFGILIASILYGYGIDALAGQDWDTLQIFGVGLLFNHTLTTFPLLIKKLFSK